MKTEQVRTDDALVDLCAHLRSQPVIAVDTEFQRERTFYAQLALVQVASTERIACIDPLAGLDLAPLEALMLDEQVLKVFHAGRQDMEIFLDRTEHLPTPIFDTQVAASLVGRGDQLGYAALVKQVCGVQLSKLHTRTDWMRRPLDADVLEYAALDVTYLLEVYQALNADLEKLGRAAWLREEQAMLTDPDTYIIPEDEAWKRVKGTGKLKGVECAVAQRLAGWREARARKANRPRRRVLSDEAIVDLARQRPKQARAMDRMRSIDRGVRNTHGDELVEVIQAAAKLPKEAWPRTRGGSPTAPVDAALLDALSAVVAAVGRQANVSPQVLASRADLTDVATGQADAALLSGWRGELAGKQLKAFLNGDVRLEVADGVLNLVGAD